MADFSTDEIQFLKEINFDPRFAAICRRLREDHGGVPKYRSGDAKPAEAKHDEWVYRSGIDDGIELVLKSLGYDY